MASYGITPLDVLNKVQSENVELPSGRIEGSALSSVRTKSRLSSPQEFNDLIIKEDQNNIVRFQDVGRAELAALNERTVLKEMVFQWLEWFWFLYQAPITLKLWTNSTEGWSLLGNDMPDDIRLHITFDSTKFIRNSIKEVQETIFIAFILVVSIIFLFLRDWRTTFIPVLTIPISLIGVFFIMYLMGFSINVLTLLGIVLSIGLVVDDAIVVLENIYTRIEKGENPDSAAEKGAEEIFFAVIATTVALAAVFLPVIFLTGTTGRLFREFGIVVAGAVIISSFVALTMTPMLSSKLLKKRERQNAFYRFTEPFFLWLNGKYEVALDGFMRFRWSAFVIILVMGFGIYWLFSVIPTELAPTEDRGEMRVNITGPEGATFAYMDNVLDEMLEDFIEQIPAHEREAITTVTSPGFGTASTNSGFLRLILTDISERDRSQQEVFAQVSKWSKYTAVRAL